VRTSIVMLTHTRTGTRTNPHNDTGLCIKKRKTHALCVPSFQATNTHAAPPVGKGHLTQSGKVISQLPTLPPSVGDSCEVTHKRERINEATHCPQATHYPSVSGSGCNPPSGKGVLQRPVLSPARVTDTKSPPHRCSKCPHCPQLGWQWGSPSQRGRVYCNASLCPPHG